MLGFFSRILAFTSLWLTLRPVGMSGSLCSHMLLLHLLTCSPTHPLTLLPAEPPTPPCSPLFLCSHAFPLSLVYVYEKPSINQLHIPLNVPEATLAVDPSVAVADTLNEFPPHPRPAHHTQRPHLHPSPSPSLEQHSLFALIPPSSLRPT